MANKIKIIFNPKANLGRAWTLADALRSLLPEGVAWTETAYPKHAQEIAAHSADEGYDQVIAIGGDGTVHEVLNGLMEIPVEKRPALGIVPTGSGNDFSFAAGVTHDPEEALPRTLAGVPHMVDVGLARLDNGQQFYWTNAIGIGFDTLVTIHSRRIPVLQGFALYFAAVLQTILLNYEPFHARIRIDDQEWEKEMLMIVLCNGQREGGGFYVSPEGHPDDSIMDYVGVGRISRLRMLMTLPYFMKREQAGLSYVQTGQFRKLVLKSDRPLYIHTDGEILAGFGSNVRQLSAEILPGALRMIS